MILDSGDLLNDLNRWKKPFINELKALGRSKNTIYLYESSINAFIEFMHEYQEELTIKELKTMQFTSYLSYMDNLAENRLNSSKKAIKYTRNGNALKNSSKSAYLKGVKKFFDFISDNNDDLYSFERFFKNIKLTAQTNSSDNIDYLSEEQVIKLSNYMEKEKVTKDNYSTYMKVMLVKLMLHAGLRISEALNVSLGDFGNSYDDDVYTLKVHAKGGKIQIAHIIKELINDEIEYMKEQGYSLSDVLFFNSKHKPMDRNQSYRLVNTIYKKADLGYGVKGQHLLRHTFGMRLVRQGENPLNIKELMRHDKIESTMVYIEALKENVIGALKKLKRNENK